jgi:hypothetical protein
MVLHYAHLCKAAGGVDAFLIGSEMRGLTTIRSSAAAYPQDGSGDVCFHLDPIWADPNTGFIGIDNYMPLSDWLTARSCGRAGSAGDPRPRL